MHLLQRRGLSEKDGNYFNCRNEYFQMIILGFFKEIIRQKKSHLFVFIIKIESFQSLKILNIL